VRVLWRPTTDARDALLGMWALRLRRMSCAPTDWHHLPRLRPQTLVAASVPMDHKPLIRRLDPHRFPTPAPVRGPDARAMAELLGFCQRYGLDRQSRIRACLATVRSDDPDVTARALVELAALVRPYREFHREHPYVTVTTGLDGAIVLGLQTADHRPIGLTTNDVNLHGTIVGPSGSGKTTALFTIAAQLLEPRGGSSGTLLSVIDCKEDFGWLLRRPDVLLIDEATRWNPLLPLPFLTAHEARNEAIELILARFYGAEHQRQHLHEAWEDAARRHGVVTISDLVESLRSLASPKEPASRAEARRGCIARLRRFEDHALYTTREDGIPWNVLLNSTFVVRTRAGEDTARLAYDLIARYCYLQDRHERRRGLYRVLVIDESYALFAAQHDGIRSIEPLVMLKQLCREFGTGVLTSTVTLDGLSTLSRASTHFHLALPPNNQEEAQAIIRVLGLSPDTADHFLHHMRPGDALLRIGNCPDVVHLHITPIDVHKHATHDEILAARERTNQLAPTQHFSPNCAAKEGIASNGQPTSAQEPAPSFLAPSRVAPVVEQPTAYNTPKVSHNSAVISLNAPEIPLNTSNVPLNSALHTRERDEAALIARRGIMLVSEVIAALGVHPMQESRTRKTLRAYGLVEEHRIAVHAGRGGTGIALLACDKAYKILDIAKPHLGKGGAQHRYALRELRDHLGAALEVKQTDAVIAYDTERHARLRAFLDIAFTDGDTIGIEVECANPKVTLQANLDRDQYLTWVIVATLPQQVDQLRRRHASARVRVVDLLQLLDALRTTEGR